MRKIGVFGGTFDPIHVGHLMVAADVHEALGLDRTLFVPVGEPPHRGSTVLDAEARLALVAAAVSEDDRFDVWDGEVRRAGPSYTVDTLEALRTVHPGDALFLTMGTDQYEVLNTWHRWERIAELATIVVVERTGSAPSDGHTVDLTDGPGPGHQTVRTRRVDVSSTEVRERLATGRSVLYLVPDSVRRIIEDNTWYKSG